jgi:deazaflavin-dependent oxidoreductase (nitroreductase family)
MNPLKLMKIGQTMHRSMYALGLGPLIGRIVLLLTTTGRKTGKRRVTPLQYEEIDGVYYIGAARGVKADWFRNLVANPQVEVRVKQQQFHGVAEPITDPTRIADYLETRLQHHPRMVGAMLRMHNLPSKPSRAQLEELAPKLAVAAIRPTTSNVEPFDKLRAGRAT